MSCPSSIRRRDSNPRPLDREPPPITTRPGLPPTLRFFLMPSCLSLSSFSLSLSLLYLCCSSILIHLHLLSVCYSLPFSFMLTVALFSDFSYYLHVYHLTLSFLSVSPLPLLLFYLIYFHLLFVCKQCSSNSVGGCHFVCLFALLIAS